MIEKRLAQEINRQVTTAELREALDREIGAEERDEVLSLVRWFTTRYDRPEARLSYIRRVYERWRSVPGRRSQG